MIKSIYKKNVYGVLCASTRLYYMCNGFAQGRRSYSSFKCNKIAFEMGRECLFCIRVWGSNVGTVGSVGYSLYLAIQVFNSNYGLVTE